MKQIEFKRLLVLLVVGLIVYWDVFLINKYFNFLNNKNSFASRQRTFVEVEKQIQKNDTSGTLLKDEIKTNLADIKSYLFKNLRVNYGNSDMLAFIAKSAGALGLKDVRPSIVKSEVYKQTSDGAWIKSILKINFRARYHEASRMINYLERSPYLLRVAGYTMNRGSKDKKGPIYIRVVAVFYRFE